MGDPSPGVRPHHPHPLSQSVGQVTTQIGCGYLALGPVGLLLGQVIGQSAGITTLALAFHRARADLGAPSGWREMARVAARFANLPAFGTGAALLNGGAGSRRPC